MNTPAFSQTCPLPDGQGAVAGLFPSSVASSKWIWTDDDPERSNVWVYARRHFAVQRRSDAWLNITADLRYLAWINGQMVGFGPPKAHWTTPTLDRYPISEHVKRGSNVVVILVYSLGNVSDISSVMPRRGALFGSIECDDKIIPTDDRWKMKRERAYLESAIRRGEVQPHNEVFDDRMSLKQPWRSTYADYDWGAAIEISDGPLMAPYQCLEPRDIPLFQWQTRWFGPVIENGIAHFDRTLSIDCVDGVAEGIFRAERSPGSGNTVTIHDTECSVQLDARGSSDETGCYARWDMGDLWTGYPVIEVRGDPGTVIDLSYAEHLIDDRLDPTKNGMNYFDRIILGDRPCQHRIMWPKCFRYLQVDVRGGRAVIQRVGVEISTYPVEHRGSFQCNDPILNRVWQICAHTLQLCMEDSYMDTPWRERGSWLGDVNIEAHANYYAFGDTKLIRRFLLHHARGQLCSGAMQGKYPGRCSSHISTWSLMFALALDDYVSYCGDVDLARELWPTVQQTAQWLEQYRTPEGGFGNFPLHVDESTNIYTFIDWAPIDTSGSNAAFNAFAYAFYGALDRLGRCMGRREEAAVYQQRRQALKQIFGHLFWDANRQVFINGYKEGSRLKRWGCHENVLALLFDLGTSSQRHEIIKQLENNDLLSYFVSRNDRHDMPEACTAIALNRYRWDDQQMVPLGTPYFGYWAMLGWCEQKRVDLALDLIRTHWGNIVRQGGTTTWEQWDQEGSLSHGFGAGPIVVLGKYVLGVTWDRMDSNCVSILPHAGNLTHAHGCVPTPNGLIEVTWCRDPQWSLKVTVPDGCDALIGLPEEDVKNLVLNGERVLSPLRKQSAQTNYFCVTVNRGCHQLQ